MVNYPVEFNATSSTEEEEGTWKTKSTEGLEIEMSTPEEFGGSDKHPSPETLFCASFDSCVAATFKAIAGRKELDYDSLKTKTKALLDRGEDSRPMIKEAEVEVRVEGVKDSEKAKKIAQATERNCFIHNSIETEVEMNFDFDK